RMPPAGVTRGIRHALHILPVFAPAALLALAGVLPRPALAQSINLGGQVCTVNYVLVDYYSDGVRTRTAWEQNGITCFAGPGVPHSGPTLGDAGPGQGNPGNSDQVRDAGERSCEEQAGNPVVLATGN